MIWYKLDQAYYKVIWEDIVEDKERTQFCPQTNRPTIDGWTDGQGENSIPPFNFIEAGVW